MPVYSKRSFAGNVVCPPACSPVCGRVHRTVLVRVLACRAGVRAGDALGYLGVVGANVRALFLRACVVRGRGACSRVFGADKVAG